MSQYQTTWRLIIIGNRACCRSTIPLPAATVCGDDVRNERHPTMTKNFRDHSLSDHAAEAARPEPCEPGGAASKPDRRVAQANRLRSPVRTCRRSAIAVIGRWLMTRWAPVPTCAMAPELRFSPRQT